MAMGSGAAVDREWEASGGDLGSVEDGNAVAVPGGNGIWTMVQRICTGDGHGMEMEVQRVEPQVDGNGPPLIWPARGNDMGAWRNGSGGERDGDVEDAAVL